MEGVWIEFGTWGEAFGWSAKCGPPTGAGLLKEEQLGAVLGADQAGRDYLRVVENEQIFGSQDLGEIPHKLVGKRRSISLYQEQARRVPWLGRGNSNVPRRQMIIQETVKRVRAGSRLTGGLCWANFQE